nr:3224_t:CDS:2 [Entrophospora candida]
MDKNNKKTDKIIITDITNNSSSVAEIHTPVEVAHKAEEEARQERASDKEIEEHAHKEADLVKQDFEKLQEIKK